MPPPPTRVLANGPRKSAYSYSESVRSGLNDFDPNQHVTNTAVVSVLQDAHFSDCCEL